MWLYLVIIAVHIFSFCIFYEYTALTNNLSFYYSRYLLVQTVPGLQRINLVIFQLYSGKKVTCIQQKSFLEFWFFLGHTILSHTARQCQYCQNFLDILFLYPLMSQTYPSRSPAVYISGESDDYSYTILCFTFSSVFNKLHEILNTLL